MKTYASIRGLGAHVPEKILTNADLAVLVDTSDEWITSRTGIKTRHIVAEGQSNSDLAAKAAQIALDNSGLDPAELTHIIVCTSTPDAACPSTACMLQRKLGLKGAMAFDMAAACAGFVYGLETAQGFIAANPKAKILLVASETLSHRSNWKDRGTCVLFGDGAGAVVMESAGSAGKSLARLKAVCCAADGSYNDLLMFEGGGSLAPYKLGDIVGENYFIRMQGREVFKHAVRKMPEACKEVLYLAGLPASAVDLFIPHQANQRIIEAAAERLGFPLEKVFTNVHKYGNTSAASIPLALYEALNQGAIKPGMLVLCATFGGGLTWGAALLEF